MSGLVKEFYTINYEFLAYPNFIVADLQHLSKAQNLMVPDKKDGQKIIHTEK